MPYRGKPILGIVGGIGSGKSYIARLLGELGCSVIHSDDVAHAVYAEPEVIRTLVGWYGDAVLTPAGAIDRKAIAARIFRDAAERSRLEALVHPLIHAKREEAMAAAAGATRAFVWDSPLLVEAGLHAQCDAILFVDTRYDERLRRVRESRGWDEGELSRREASQAGLDEKMRLATHILRGDRTREELARELDRILKSL